MEILLFYLIFQPKKKYSICASHNKGQMNCQIFKPWGSGAWCSKSKLPAETGPFHLDWCTKSFPCFAETLLVRYLQKSLIRLQNNNKLFHLTETRARLVGGQRWKGRGGGGREKGSDFKFRCCFYFFSPSGLVKVFSFPFYIRKQMLFS